MRYKIMTITVVALLCVAVILGFIIFIVSTNQGGIAGNNTPVPTSEATPDGGTETSAPTEPPTEEPTPTPEPPLAGLIIGIDPGHQKKMNGDKEPCAPWGPEGNSKVNKTVMKTKTSSGTQGKFTNQPEYIVTLDISLKIKAKLEALGATVVMTRETHDVDLSNIDRANICNEAGCDVTLRIHCNGADKESVNGVEAWIRGVGDGTKEYKELGEYEKQLAEELLRYYVNSTGAINRGVKTSDNYTGLNWSTVPSIIIECGFMSNEEEDNKLASAEYQQQIADGIANWLLNTKVLKQAEQE
ncbi:MAG: N-acetylmuramoyl-L-alanine amidase [Clostridia bacterium]|nr:N-acetylmuramoyl-L-alanine amidase [Clostridia bacterium]